MKTKAVRMYGKNDLRLEEFELPSLKTDEMLAKIVTDSICMSTYKAALQGADHKRVPSDINSRPIIVGHEFCGEIVEVGPHWAKEFQPGTKFVMQTALNYKGSMEAPGFSFPYVGGDATYITIPSVVMELGNLINFESDCYYLGSLVEPMSCIIGAFHASYHTRPGSYVHQMGIKEGGSMALLASCGPMGLGAIDYALHSDRRPSALVVTDIDSERLDRASSIYTVEKAAQLGVKLTYVNTAKLSKPVSVLKEYAPDGFDDVFVFAPVPAVIEQGDGILGKDGCLNFFAGPTDRGLSAKINFYNVHYNATHIVGTSGGNTDDMKEAVQLVNEGRLDPSSMITHVGGLNSVIETTLNLPRIAGGKKLVYTQVDMPMTALSDIGKLADINPLYKDLDEIIRQHNGLWSPEAEKCLLGYK